MEQLDIAETEDIETKLTAKDKPEALVATAKAREELGDKPSNANRLALLELQIDNHENRIVNIEDDRIKKLEERVDMLASLLKGIMTEAKVISKKADSGVLVMGKKHPTIKRIR